MAATPNFKGAPNCGGVTFVNADGTTPKTVRTAGANGAMVEAFSAVTDDTNPIELDVFVDDGSNVRPIGCVEIPATAGTETSVPGVNLLPSLPNARNMFGTTTPAYAFVLNANEELQVAPKSAVTSTKSLYVRAELGDY